MRPARGRRSFREGWNRRRCRGARTHRPGPRAVLVDLDGIALPSVRLTRTISAARKGTCPCSHHIGRVVLELHAGIPRQNTARRSFCAASSRGEFCLASNQENRGSSVTSSFQSNRPGRRSRQALKRTIEARPTGQLRSGQAEGRGHDPPAARPAARRAARPCKEHAGRAGLFSAPRPAKVSPAVGGRPSSPAQY